MFKIPSNVENNSIITLGGRLYKYVDGKLTVVISNSPLNVAEVLESYARKDEVGTNIDLSNYFDKNEVENLVATKQDPLVSGENIKTINNESIIGSGNLEIVGIGGGGMEGSNTLSNPKLNEEVLTEHRHMITGKPLYKKTIDIGSLPNATIKNVPHGVTGFEYIGIDLTNSYIYTPSNSAFSYSGAFTVWNNKTFDIGSYIDGSNISISTGSDRSTMSGYVTVVYTKQEDTLMSPVKKIGSTGLNGKDNFELWKSMLGNENKTLTDYFNSLKGKDGTVQFDSLTPEQRLSLVGEPGPKGPGLEIKYSFESVYDMENSLTSPDFNYQNADLVHLGEETITAVIDEYQYYISPNGNDITGDGTRTKPWKTLKKCPKHSKIGLLEGIYSDTDPDYAPFNPSVGQGYVAIPGIFKGMLGGTQAVESSPIALPEIKALHANWGSLSSSDKFTVIGAADGDGTVIIKMTNSTATRDYAFFCSDPSVRVIFRNLTIDASRNRNINYSASWTSFGSGFTAYINCTFKETGYYSLSYNNTYSTLYINSTFTGTKLDDYSGVAIKVTDVVFETAYNYFGVTEDVSSAKLFMFDALNNKFNLFIDTAKLLTLRGPKGKDGIIKWDDLTEAQLDYLRKGPRGAGVAKGGKTGDILIKKSERDFDVGWGSIPEIRPSLGENISTMLVNGDLYITNTGLPGYGDPIKTRYSNGVLYITTTGIDP